MRITKRGLLNEFNIEIRMSLWESQIKVLLNNMSLSGLQLTIDNNVYREISCMESHLLVPFSNGSSGALTTTKSSLRLDSEAAYGVSEFLDKSKLYTYT